MKQLLIIIGMFSFLQQSIAQDKKPVEVNYHPNDIKDSSKKSIPAATQLKIGNASIRINYYSPAVRGRSIWGGLVPYNDVWVTGAHQATNIVLDKPISVNGKKIAAGKYALFTIPGKEEWIFIINKNYQQHLSDDYDAKEDLLRVTVKPVTPEQSLERLEYFINSTGKNRGTISIQWEKIKIEIPFTVVD